MAMYALIVTLTIYMQDKPSNRNARVAWTLSV